MGEPIQFPAVVYKVQTLSDQGLRVTLDLPETEIMSMAMLAECKRMGVVLNVTAAPVVQDTANPDTPDVKKSRPERKSLRGG